MPNELLCCAIEIRFWKKLGSNTVALRLTLNRSCSRPFTNRFFEGIPKIKTPITRNVSLYATEIITWGFRLASTSRNTVTRINARLSFVECVSIYYIKTSSNTTERLQWYVSYTVPPESTRLTTQKLNAVIHV